MRCRDFLRTAAIYWLQNIKTFLTFNEFENTKRQNYRNKEYGLILEDMHDENVISRQEVLFFIDTVFYVI
jgi:hypothetical protein